MNKHNSWDSEVDVDKLIRDHDETFMALPDIEFEPHLLISKVRKYYLEYIIKSLTTNYETNHRLLNKNIYIPSAIWKCAKKLEMEAAQACMVLELYRKCALTMINEVKADTKKGRLYSKLYECLHLKPQNEKRTQTTVTGESCQCKCKCNERKKRLKRSSPVKELNNTLKMDHQEDRSTKVYNLSQILHENNNYTEQIQTIPVVTNMQTDHIPVLPELMQAQQQANNYELMQAQQQANNYEVMLTQQQANNYELRQAQQQQPKLDSATIQPAIAPMNPGTDEVMEQLEALFHDDKDDEDDLFTGTVENNPNTLNRSKLELVNVVNVTHGAVESYAAEIKSLNDRLVQLTGLIENNSIQPQSQTLSLQPEKEVLKKSKYTRKWLCEEYYLRRSLFDVLYQIGDNNRQAITRIKALYVQLFGEDSDDEEGLMSPVESPELVASCKSRIDCWVKTVLAPFYAKGRIKGKLLYKAVARHLIELIYKCKRYPSRHEVTSFVMDFLENHSKIRCEADFKEFRIDNVHV